LPEAFKNLINASVVKRLSALVSKALPSFPAERFETHCLSRIGSLELKDRARCIGDALWEALPEPPEEAISVLEKAVSQIPPLREDESSADWILFPVNALLSRHGLEAFDSAFALLPIVTKRFTAEFAIRPFIVERPLETLRLLMKWTQDPNHHVRRLVSEGTRPRLPWAQQIKAFKKDPEPIFPLLEQLKDDPSEYVRRSVANNLNDISKDNPDRMLDTIEDWLRQASPQRMRLIRHACRSLVKQGDRRCLALLGFAPARLEVEGFAAKPSAITLGERLLLKAELRSTERTPQKLVVDYEFHLIKANGLAAAKVFKGSLVELAGGEGATLAKRFHLKPISTRKYYSGTNLVKLLINGEPLAETEFQLIVP